MKDEDVPVHIDEVSSDMTVVAGEMPLTEAQIEKLVKLVIRRMEQKKRQARQNRDATQIDRSAAPPMSPGEE